MKRSTTILLSIGLAFALNLIGCDGANGQVSGKSLKPIIATSPDQREPMKISLKFQNKFVTATLFDNETSRDFASLLPLTLTLKDYGDIEKISDLPRKLSKDSAPSGSKPVVGDLSYYSPWGNLALFLKDFEYSKGLIPLGRIDSIETLKVPGSIEVTVELITPHEPK